MQIAIFSINNREFAISVEYLQTVLKATKIFNVPLSSPEKLGLINFQGEILTVFHLGEVFDKKKNKTHNENVILIIGLKTKHETWKLGIYVDRIIDIQHIEENQISELPEETDINRNFVSNSIKMKDKSIWLINLENILIPNEIEF